MKIASKLFLSLKIIRSIPNSTLPYMCLGEVFLYKYFRFALDKILYIRDAN